MFFREFVESDSPECSVCSETRANVTFEPCMHKVVCAQCSQRMKKCLICKSSIKTKIGPGGCCHGNWVGPGWCCHGNSVREVHLTILSFRMSHEFFWSGGDIEDCVF